MAEVTETYWSRFADTYDRNQQFVVGRELLDQITNELGELPDLIEALEAGCGTGVFTGAIVKKSKRVVATDLSDSLLEVAKRRLYEHPNVTMQKQNCMSTSFPSEAFDTVFMANLIHVVENPATALQECHRILRNNGTLLIVTFTGHGMKPWEKIKMGLRFLKAWGKPPAHTRSFSPENLTSMMEKAGFTVQMAKLLGNRMKALYAIGKKD